MERCYDLSELPEVDIADYLEVTPHQGRPSRWGFHSTGFLNNVTLCSYNETEFLLYHGVDSFEEYIEEFGDANGELPEEDYPIIEFFEKLNPMAKQVWELCVDHGSYSSSYWYRDIDVCSSKDVHKILREGLDILCRDYRKYEWKIELMEQIEHDLDALDTGFYGIEDLWEDYLHNIYGKTEPAYNEMTLRNAMNQQYTDLENALEKAKEE
jgi:hypothetical protein